MMWGVLRWTRRTIVLLVVLIMLAFNILTLTVGAVAAAVSAVLGSFGIETVVDVDRTRSATATPDGRATPDGELEDLRRRNAALASDLDAAERRAATALADVDMLRGERLAAQEAQDLLRGQIDTISRRISVRTGEVAAANLGATAGEAIPFYGVAIVVAATGYELWGACETMKDMRDLNLALGLATGDEDVTRVCGLRVPTTAEIWRAIRNSPAAVWDAATSGLSGAGSWVAGLEMPDLSMPDFGGWWDWAMSWWYDEADAVPE